MTVRQSLHIVINMTVRGHLVSMDMELNAINKGGKLEVDEIEILAD